MAINFEKNPKKRQIALVAIGERISLLIIEDS